MSIASSYLSRVVLSSLRTLSLNRLLCDIIRQLSKLLALSLSKCNYNASKTIYDIKCLTASRSTSSSVQLIEIIKKLIKLFPYSKIDAIDLVKSSIENYKVMVEYEATRKYHPKNIENSNCGENINRLQTLLIGNVIDAVSSFAVSQPKHICILDEVVTSSREYKEGEASGWDDFMENMKSDMWDEMKEQSKASLQYISKKRIPLKKIKDMGNIGNGYKGIYTIGRGCFAYIRLDKVIEIDVSDTDITDADMADLGRACPNMQKLNIAFSENITDVGLLKFSRYCHGLKDINMKECKNITNAGLIEFSKNCRGLQKVDLQNCGGIFGGGIEGLSQYCHDLRIITIGGYVDYKNQFHVSDSDDSEFHDSEYYGSESDDSEYDGSEYYETETRGICTDADLLALSFNCQQLQEIHLNDCYDVTDDGLIEMSKHLNNSKQFHHISITKCYRISHRGVIGFSKKYPHLKSIEIHSNGDSDHFTDDCIIEVSKNCSSLESLDIHSNDWATHKSMNAIARNCHSLKKINISRCDNITEASFINMIESCSNLESIDISNYNKWVTDVSMNAIAKNCHGLKDINMSTCRIITITETSFINLIENCSGLESIDIHSNDWVTDKSMNAIAKNCHDLQNINFIGCRNITEVSFISMIESCSKLERIDIGSYNNWVTDESINAIEKNCHGLKYLNIEGHHHNSGATKMALAERFPGVMVIG